MNKEKQNNTEDEEEIRNNLVFTPLDKLTVMEGKNESLKLLINEFNLELTL